MIPELFITTFTVCVQLYPPVRPCVYGDCMPISDGRREGLSPLGVEEKTKPKTEECVPSFRFSTSSATQQGEAAYRVVQATATVCDLFGHDWNENYQWRYSAGTDDYGWYQNCRRCPKRRRKVTKTEWVEEPWGAEREKSK